MGRLQTARLENLIRRWGSIKGEGSVLAETLGDVFPTFDLNNLTPELLATAGWTPFFIFSNVIGIAAQLPGLAILNPAGSQQLVVVQKAIIRRETTGIVTVGTTGAGTFVANINTRIRDTRLGGITGKVLMRVGTNVGASETGMSINCVAGIDRELELPGGLAILAPGDQLGIIGATVNDNLTISFSGQVRDAEPSELSF